jgi:hypothetical protein
MTQAELSLLLRDALVVVYGMQKYCKVFLCEIDLPSYDAGKREIPSLPSPPAICVNHCLGHKAILMDEDAGRPGVISIVFDQGEPFLRTMYKNWQVGRKRGERSGWPAQVASISPGDASKTFGLQAVDFLVGLRHYSEVNDTCRSLFDSLSPYLLKGLHSLLDKERIAATTRSHRMVP